MLKKLFLFVSRQKRDHEDTQRVLEFLRERNPFQREDPDLRNICNGMKADGNVNVDEAAKIGEKIISSMAGESVSNYTFKKANSVIKSNAKNALVIDGDIVSIDPQLLFQRLMLITRDMDENEVKDVFKYELSQKPSALFDELGFMRETNSSSLYDTLWKKVGCNTKIESLQDFHFILNGHSLINKIPWQKNETFDAICLKYVKYVAQYERPTVIFENNYDSTPSVKDEIHLRRTKGIPGRDVLFTGTMLLNCKKELFLSNTSNMQRFINMLGKVLHENDCNVLYSSNTVAKIAETAMNAANSKETVVVGGDITELVVLCHHFESDGRTIWFQSDERKPKMSKLWDLERMNEVLGGNVMKSLVFMHVLVGSVGTSHLFGLNTSTILKKFNDVAAFRDSSSVFLSNGSETSEIAAAGKKAVCILYNGKPAQELNDLRYTRFLEKVSSRTTAVQVQSLPPTEAAVHYHSLRMFYQIQTWIGTKTLDPLQYGWELKNNMLRPKTTDLEPAPARLLSKIRCGCKGSCNTKRCNCRKFNMKCTTACAECKGLSCLNTMPKIIDEDDDHEDDDYDDA